MGGQTGGDRSRSGEGVKQRVVCVLHHFTAPRLTGRPRAAGLIPWKRS